MNAIEIDKVLCAVVDKLSEYGISYNKQINEGLNNISTPLTRRERIALKRKEKKKWKHQVRFL